ncbi:hypothetical protein IV203_013492 [Nitzschia inconspicua]|uniref:Uncharacterized protein n=1 Tax=Nitzschia inconspicua TaxID=303405 RepID=A0A9K3Q7I3_9STRA|nr:hypothetical protein IV203_013492 [Nitzschia inconspicua]
MKVVNLKQRLSSFGRSTSVDSSAGSETSSQDGSHHSDDDSTHFGSGSVKSSSSSKKGDLPPPVLVYHESARSIVFRDHVRRACDVAEEQQARLQGIHGATRHQSFLSDRPLESPKVSRRLRSLSEHYVQEDPMLSSELTEMSNLFGAPDSFTDSIRSLSSVEIQGFQPHVVPLPQLKLGYKDVFEPLLEAPESQHEQYWTEEEKLVVDLLQNQRAVVKTIKNSEWTSFLHRFKCPQSKKGKYPSNKDDIGPHGERFPFNSFVTPTSLLPAGGKKMRCYGAPATYTTGVVFALPIFDSDQSEEEAAKQTGTWSWPSGYSAKTEFNVNARGELINGREEALVSHSKLRQFNKDYLNKTDYIVAGRLVNADQIKTVPYNEVFLRVGGLGRVGPDGKMIDGSERSFDQGSGLPIALFVRTATYGHLISLLRTRARLLHIFGEKHVKGLPLMMITPELGVRILTENLQHKLLKIAARQLNPFQNSVIAHKTKIDDTDPTSMETKLEELLDLDEKIRETLTPEECARICGGFGATDDSIAQVLRDAMVQDKQHMENGDMDGAHELQDIVNEGLASAVRASDFYTSRQLLILYSLVASEGHQMEVSQGSPSKSLVRRKSSLDTEAMLVQKADGTPLTLSEVKKSMAPPPPPPPLDTDRLRSATNSDGLLAVLGAAQILKSMQDGSAKKRTEESFLAVEEWVEQGEQNMAFRLASWRDQRAAQGDLEIAVDRDSSFMAFVSNKAISNRKNFASQLRQAVEQTDFNDMRFLTAIYEIVNRMHSPCLRLELLQYVLGLDNRYSVAHVKRAVELAATCLSISHSAQPPDVVTNK